ncbi:MAG: SDR family oxidoreductase [Chloroflexota bacterium]
MNLPFVELKGQVAIITGAAQGIGQGCAELLASDGVTVVVADIAEAEGQQAVKQIHEAGGKAIFSSTDVGKHEEIQGLVADTVAQFGRLDIVINNAYWSTRKSVVDLPEEEWDKGMNVMLKSAYLFGKYGFPEMKKVGKGAMVNIASVHGLAAISDYPVYAAAKAGLINLTRQMAVDGGPLGIRVNAICPGWIQNRGHATLSERRAKIVKKVYPLGRGGFPREIATAVRFLVSEQASFITGHALVVDGGMTAQLQDSVSDLLVVD